MKSFFKYAVIIIFVVAALLTPPDILTQLLMAGPLIILYGISILLVRMVNPADDDETDDIESAEDGVAILKDALGIEDDDADRSPKDK